MIPVVGQSEAESLLATLVQDERVTIGVGEGADRGWFRAQVVAHDPANGHLTLTCFMDRPTDRPLEPGEHVVVTASSVADEARAAPMFVEDCGDGPQPLVALRIAGAWQPAEERRNQTRVPLQLHATRARRWTAGAWRDVDATIVDLSSRGVGLRIDHEVHVGDRLSLLIPLNDAASDLRVTVELRHVRADVRNGEWRAGGLFRTLAPGDHERIIRFIFGELRSRR